MKNPLFLRFALAFLVLLLFLGGLIGWITINTAEAYYDEANQKLHKELAQFTVDHTNTFTEENNVDTTAIQDIMHSMMVINPDVEVYLVDDKGKLITYVAPYKKVIKESIDLAPIKEFIDTKGEVSVKGDDPRSHTGKKVFSAAPILKNDNIIAYYYIILASQERASVLESIKSNLAFGLASKLILGSLLVALLFGMLYIWYHTKQLSPILNAMNKFSDGDYSTRIPEHDSTLGTISKNYNKMANQIEQNIAKIKSMDEFRKELIANVSHDMRTPLTVIKGYAETLLLKSESLSTKEQGVYLENIAESTNRANGLLNQLFELSKLENNQIKLKKEAFALEELVSDLVSNYKLLLKEKNIEVGFEGSNLPMVYGDIALVERVVQNLLDNAIKYSPSNSLIKIKLEAEKDDIIFSIQDQGEGMSKNQLVHIFDRYKRLAPTEKGNKSLGLGLAISKKIIELHNSTIEVQSMLKEGTTFRFALHTA